MNEVIDLTTVQRVARAAMGARSASARTEGLAEQAAACARNADAVLRAAGMAYLGNVDMDVADGSEQRSDAAEVIADRLVAYQKALFEVHTAVMGLATAQVDLADWTGLAGSLGALAALEKVGIPSAPESLMRDLTEVADGLFSTGRWNEGREILAKALGLADVRLTYLNSFLDQACANRIFSNEWLHSGGAPLSTLAGVVNGRQLPILDNGATRVEELRIELAKLAADVDHVLVHMRVPGSK